MDMPSTPVIAIEAGKAHASLQRLSASIAVANGLALSGRTIDLAGLDAAAGLMCAQVLDLEPREGLALRPAIRALNHNIDSLIKALRIQDS